jgi:hypothetical protein
MMYMLIYPDLVLFWQKAAVQNWTTNVHYRTMSK